MAATKFSIVWRQQPHLATAEGLLSYPIVAGRLSDRAAPNSRPELALGDVVIVDNLSSLASTLSAPLVPQQPVQEQSADTATRGCVNSPRIRAFTSRSNDAQSSSVVWIDAPVIHGFLRWRPIDSDAQARMRDAVAWIGVETEPRYFAAEPFVSTRRFRFI